MTKKRKKKCKYCKKLFPLNKKVIKNQKVCSAKKCQQLRKKENSQAFKRRNPDYWDGRYDDYLVGWRKNNPDYQKQWYEEKKNATKNKIENGKKQNEKFTNLIDSISNNIMELREIQVDIFVPAP